MKEYLYEVALTKLAEMETAPKPKKSFAKKIIGATALAGGVAAAAHPTSRKWLMGKGTTAAKWTGAKVKDAGSALKARMTKTPTA